MAAHEEEDRLGAGDPSADDALGPRPQPYRPRHEPSRRADAAGRERRGALQIPGSHRVAVQKFCR